MEDKWSEESSSSFDDEAYAQELQRKEAEAKACSDARLVDPLSVSVTSCNQEMKFLRSHGSFFGDGYKWPKSLREKRSLQNILELLKKEPHQLEFRSGRIYYLDVIDRESTPSEENVQEVKQHSPSKAYIFFSLLAFVIAVWLSVSGGVILGFDLTTENTFYRVMTFLFDSLHWNPMISLFVLGAIFLVIGAGLVYYYVKSSEERDPSTQSYQEDLKRDAPLQMKSQKQIMLFEEIIGQENSDTPYAIIYGQMTLEQFRKEAVKFVSDRTVVKQGNDERHIFLLTAKNVDEVVQEHNSTGKKDLPSAFVNVSCESQHQINYLTQTGGYIRCKTEAELQTEMQEVMKAAEQRKKEEQANKPNLKLKNIDNPDLQEKFTEIDGVIYRDQVIVETPKAQKPDPALQFEQNDVLTTTKCSAAAVSKDKNDQSESESSVLLTDDSEGASLS